MLKCGYPSSNFIPTGTFLGKKQDVLWSEVAEPQVTSGLFVTFPSVARSVISVLAIDILQSLKKLAEIGQKVQKLFWGERGK